MSQVGTVDVRVPTQIAPIKFHLATAGAGPVSLYNAIIQLGHVAPLQIEQLVEACARVDPSWKTGMRPDTLYEAAHEVLSPQDFMLTLKEHATFDDLVPGALLWVSPLALVQNVLRPGSTAHGGLPDGHELVVGERVQGLYDSPCYKWRKAGDVGTVTIRTTGVRRGWREGGGRKEGIEGGELGQAQQGVGVQRGRRQL